MNRLLIVDDDHGLVNLLKRFLEGEGFRVDAAFDHASGLSAALSSEHELIILDVMLPGGSGFELLKALRRQSSVPVLLLTARGEAVDRILGLEIGADDYLAKPFDPRELVARVRAIFRRTREPAPAPHASHEERLSIGDIDMSLATRTVTCRQLPVDLTSVEFNVLELLLRHAGNVVTREQIAEVALGRPLNTFDRSVDVHVSRLRKKLAGSSAADDLIRPIRGIGYFLAAETSHPTAPKAGALPPRHAQNRGVPGTPALPPQHAQNRGVPGTPALPPQHAQNRGVPGTPALGTPPEKSRV